MTDLWPALCVVLAVYCMGGLHGLWLAWTQEARMKRWAASLPEAAEHIYESVMDAHERGGKK
jgi:hypothetical protein